LPYLLYYTGTNPFTVTFLLLLQFLTITTSALHEIKYAIKI